MSGARRLRFGVFELDLHSRDLRRNGLRVRLQEQPFQVLSLLLERPGELVTRERLARHLWPDLHVNFERSLNTAVNALRQALSDSSRNPRFIETRSGLGYRFLAPVEVMPDERREYSGNAEAHQNYLKGRYFYIKMTAEDLHKSVAYFEAALAEDPGNALAFTGLADTYCQFAFMGVLPAKEAYARAREFTLSALRLDRDLAEAHACLARLKKLHEWDWAGAEAEYLRALELNPNYASGHQQYAAHLAAMGRHDEAIREGRRAQELDPLSLVINMELAWSLYMGRDFHASMEQSWQTLAMEPRFAPAQHTLGLAYEQMGMHEEAIVELENARTCSGEHPATLAALSHAHSTAGNRREAETALHELERIAQQRHVSPYCLSLVCAGLGEDHAAFEWLSKAQAERDVWLVWLNVEPRFDRLRRDRRFDEVVKGMGLEKYASPAPA